VTQTSAVRLHIGGALKARGVSVYKLAAGVWFCCPVVARKRLRRVSSLGVPAHYVWLLEYLLATVLDGCTAYLTQGVQRALGQKPRDFTDHVRDTAATAVWG